MVFPCRGSTNLPLLPDPLPIVRARPWAIDRRLHSDLAFLPLCKLKNVPSVPIADVLLLLNPKDQAVPSLTINSGQIAPRR